jgi:di/tripeptidase
VVGGVIRSEGDTILGADDKAGIAELYEAVFTADHHPELEIVITREEETAIKEGWVDSETTCNVGIIEGGRIRNGVLEKVFIKAECRSLNHTIPA